MKKITCDRCNDELTDEMRVRNWPVTMDDGDICPDCYGDEAYCREEGHLLIGMGGEGQDCPSCTGVSEQKAGRYYHVTEVLDSGVYGHPVDCCDEAGCSGDRLSLGSATEDVEAGGIIFY